MLLGLALPGYAASVVTPTDTIPDFGADPTITSVASGPWSSPSIWSTGVLPGAGDVVAIMPGTTVTYDVASAVQLLTVEVRSGGELDFATSLTTAMTVANLEILPGGTFTVGTTDQPVAAGVKATITIADQPLDTVNDPFQFGTGIIGLGKVTMCGQPRSPSFMRMATMPHAGDTTLSLASPITGWQPGDRLIVPDSRMLNWNQHSGNYAFNIDTMALAGVAGNGLSLSLTQPLTFDHPGGYDAYGNTDYLPHVEDLSRNIVITSANPADVRGHVLMTWQAVVDIRWVGFVQMGRTLNIPLDSTTADANGNITHIGTNQIGRYPLHMHHLIGPATAPANGYQFTLVGNAIDGGDAEATAKWGIDVHGSYYGLIHGNVVYDCAGAGITTEDGSECNNLFDSNCVFWCNGTGNREDYGMDGDAFWFHGDNNWVVNNVAADIQGGVYCYGFNIFQYYLGDVEIPAAQGEEPSVTINSYVTPILDFNHNECYNSPNGLAYWWIGTFGGIDPPTPPPDSVVRNLAVWNHYQWGIFGYECYDMTIDGMTCLGDPGVLNSGNGAQGLFFSDYEQNDLVVRNCNFQNLQIGGGFATNSPGFQAYDQCTFRCYTDLFVNGIFSVSAFPAGNSPARTMYANNCSFDLSQYGVAGNGAPVIPVAVTMSYTEYNLIQSDVLEVFGYNSEPTRNYQLLYPQQVASWILPQTTYYSDGVTPSMIGSPVAGLTNAQNWATYGIAMAGEVAPANASSSMPDFNSLEVPISASLAPTLRATDPEITPPALPPGIDQVGPSLAGTGSGGGSGSGSGTGGGASTGGVTASGTAGLGGPAAGGGGGGGGGGCGLGGSTAVMFLGMALWLRASARRRRGACAASGERAREAP